MARVDPKDPSTFPAPHAFATYISWRSPSFKTHATLSITKNAISGKARGLKGRGRSVGCDCYVYQWNEEDQEWKVLHFIPQNTDLDQHPFYQQTVASKRPIKGPSDKQVDAAIQSILKAGEANGDQEG